MAPFVIGSSPRVRGTRTRGGFPPVFKRFIPACAGNAPQRPRSDRLVSVHPRVCGERSYSQCVYDSDSGSSPRVRGTQRSVRGGGGHRRFIPACAGNALWPLAT